MRITTNANKIARKFRRRAQRLSGTIAKLLLQAAVAIDAKQVDNLSGSNTAAPGSWPVPNRTGNLMGSHFWEVRGSQLAVVGNTAGYAAKIHEDRPFLDRAVDDVNVLNLFARGIQREVLAK